MIKKWEDIKVGDKLKDGSIVTQIHRTHEEESCKVIYDNDREFICSYNHILLVDVHNLPQEGKDELEEFCTYVPLEEDYQIYCEDELSPTEKLIIDQFCNNEKIDIQVDLIKDTGVYEFYDFHFDKVKRITIHNIVTKAEPQKVDENTYWLPIKGIEYLMDEYKVDLYCNDMIINKIIPMGKLPCFCISTNTGRYET